MGNREPSRRQAGRGQTALDLLVGMSVFLLTLGFVFGFVPGMFDPFVSPAIADTVTADRGAAVLVEDVLAASPNRPNVLNETCTVEFFDDDGDVADCRFESEDPHAALGIDTRHELNVTVENDGGIRTLAAGGDSTELKVGASPDPSADVTVAKRVAMLDDDEHTIYVRVW